MISFNKIINDTVINTIIVLNSIVIFLLLFPEIHNPVKNILFTVDLIFNVYFLIEIVYKLKRYGKSYYTKITNLVDIILLFVIIISIICGYYHSIYGIYSLRLIRIIKCVKLFKIIPNYNRLLKTIRIAWGTCSGLFLGIFIIFFIISILLTALYNDTEYFSNPLVSLYSVFRIFSIEGWYEIPNDIVTSNNSIIGTIFTKLIFALMVFFGGMVGMSFFTSVVTDELAADNNDEVINRLEKIEKKIDTMCEK